MLSITPYNNYKVKDLNGNKQPYVSSTTEFGYFGNLGSNQTWYSMPTYLITNNGLATVDASGLHILNAGIYTLNLSIDIYAGGKGNQNNTISFNFGSQYLVNSSVVSGSFGGTHSTKMFSFGSNSTSYPGIISWNTNAISNGNSTPSELVIQQSQLIYNYYARINSAGNLYPGVCTTEITFIVNQPTTIFFNVACNNSIQLGTSYFTLDLINTIPGLVSTISNSPNNLNWTGLASDSTGQYVVASAINSTQTAGYIYRSTDFGVTWGVINPNQTIAFSTNWRCISSSNDGAIICVASIPNSTTVACILVINSSGTILYLFKEQNSSLLAQQFISTTISTISGTTYIYVISTIGNIYYYTNNGISWTNTWTKYVSSLPTQSVASTNTAGLLIFGLNANKIYKSTNNGQTLAILGNSQVNNWAIASDSTGQYLVATTYYTSYSNSGIWTSSDYGNTWIQKVADTNKWQCVASSATGQILVAGINDATNGGAYISTDYGNNWSKINGISGAVTSVSISDDGIQICVGMYNNHIYSVSQKL